MIATKCGWCGSAFESAKGREFAGTLADPCPKCNELTAAVLEERYPYTYARWEKSNDRHDDFLAELAAPPTIEQFFTFGGEHVHPVDGRSLKNYFVRVRATTADEARIAVFRHFGRKWGFQYATAEAAGVSRFGLVELQRNEWPPARELKLD